MAKRNLSMNSNRMNQLFGKTIKFENTIFPNDFFYFSLSMVRFDAQPSNAFLLVGVARDLVLSPRSHSGGMIYCFMVLENGERLHFIHRTVVDEIPSENKRISAIHQYHCLIVFQRQSVHLLAGC